MVGVTISDSSVPSDCSCCMALTSRASPTAMKPATAIPTVTKAM